MERMPGQYVQHIAFIMDGNRRWARSRHYLLQEGYRQGAQRLQDVVTWALEIQIPYISFFAFGKDNWKRPVAEVTLLWKTLVAQAKEIEKHLMHHEVRFIPIGDENNWPQDAYQVLKALQQKTMHFHKMTVGLVIDYCGTWDIQQAMEQYQQVLLLDPKTDKKWQSFLKTASFPEPEILVRTGGEQRLSNFYLYNIAYTELFFRQPYWPDFSKNDFIDIIQSYQTRQRRFGQ